MTTPTHSIDDRRWAAVCARAAGSAGPFVYAVRTTGVFCRPGCPSRRPNRENVAFFPTCAAARRRGYRPCHKCRPESEPAGAPPAVVRACRILNAADGPPALGALAAAVGLSPSHFHRLFKAAVGVTPRAYAAARRTERLRAGLGTERTVTGAMYAAGFVSSGRCYATAGAELGMTPAAYQRGGRGTAVRFAAVECPLGWVGVGATARGVCFIEFGPGPAALRAALSRRFPSAERTDGDRRFRRWVATVVAAIEAPARAAALPLDVRGTAFQRQVWEALRAVPPGETASYAEIALRVGRPGAARAVARACAANPVAVAVPCHRIVRGDGTPGGYRWGIARKRRLLAREAGARPAGE